MYYIIKLEAGFGADIGIIHFLSLRCIVSFINYFLKIILCMHIGMEKFMHIKCRASGLQPDVVVRIYGHPLLNRFKDFDIFIFNRLL